MFQTRELDKVYGEGPSAVHALRGIDMEIPESELVVFLGASGSGKSTLLNILGGLDRASDGDAYFFGQALTEMSDGQLTQYRRHHVGFVFQFYNLMPSLTALEKSSSSLSRVWNTWKASRAWWVPYSGPVHSI